MSEMTFVHRRLESDSATTIGRLDMAVDFVIAAFADQTGMLPSSVGDINGDGRDELVQSPWMRDVFVLEARPHLAAGVYDIALRKDTPAWQALSVTPANPRRTDLSALVQYGLPYLVVPGREPMLIGPGLSVADAGGTLCLGQHRVRPDRTASQHWELQQSRMACVLAYRAILWAVLSGGAKWQIIDYPDHYIPAHIRMLAAAA